MGLFTADVNNVRDLYNSMLQKALNSERQIVEDGLPTMIQDSTNPQLREAFQTHLEESRQHVARLERILEENKGETSDSKCKVTAALISEGGSLAKDANDESLRDVVLIAAGNQVEHHEIAVYGTLRNLALILGENEQATTLEKTLEEEKKADELLTKLSQQINVQAPVGA
jgi:ferritin-like metal-binding protein YciE